MRTWTRAAYPRLCGGPCQKRIAEGEPMLLVEIVGLSKKFVRCAACAGEPVPKDLPRLAPRGEIEPSPLVRAGAVPLPFELSKLRDAKAAAAGDREPGSDDA